MTSAAAPAPKSQTGLQLHLLLVLLTLAALVVQVYFAGRGIFGESSFDAHEAMAGILHLAALILLVATIAIPATRNRGDIIQAVAFFVLIIVQSFLGDREHPAMAAFHPVVALVIIGLVFGMLMKDRRILSGG